MYAKIRNNLGSKQLEFINSSKKEGSLEREKTLEKLLSQIFSSDKYCSSFRKGSSYSLIGIRREPRKGGPCHHKKLFKSFSAEFPLKTKSAGFSLSGHWNHQSLLVNCYTVVFLPGDI